MPRRCTICQHPQAFSIDLALRAGEALRTIAERYTTSIATLSRHALHAGTASTRAPAPLQDVPLPRDVTEHVAERSGTPVPVPRDLPGQSGTAAQETEQEAAQEAGHASAPVLCSTCGQHDRVEQRGCRGDYRCDRCKSVFPGPRRA